MSTSSSYYFGVSGCGQAGGGPACYECDGTLDASSRSPDLMGITILKVRPFPELFNTRIAQENGLQSSDIVKEEVEITDMDKKFSIKPLRLTHSTNRLNYFCSNAQFSRDG